MSESDHPPAEPTLLRVGEAAKAAGVGRQTLEYYVMLGLVEPIRKPGARGRFFDDKLIRRVRLINQLNESGYTLRDIRETYLQDR